MADSADTIATNARQAAAIARQERLVAKLAEWIARVPDNSEIMPRTTLPHNIVREGLQKTWFDASAQLAAMRAGATFVANGGRA